MMKRKPCVGIGSSLLVTFFWLASITALQPTLCNSTACEAVSWVIAATCSKAGKLVGALQCTCHWSHDHWDGKMSSNIKHKSKNSDARGDFWLVNMRVGFDKGHKWKTWSHFVYMASLTQQWNAQWKTPTQMWFHIKHIDRDENTLILIFGMLGHRMSALQKCHEESKHPGFCFCVIFCNIMSAFKNITSLLVPSPTD